MSDVEAVTKPVCKATTVKGEPCRARPLSGEDFCLLHSGEGVAEYLGRSGGRRRKERKERQTEELELDENGVPVDIERWSMQRLVKLGNSDSNIAGAVAAVKEARVRTYVDASTVSVEDARLELAAKLDEIDAHRRIHAGVCKTCGGSGIGPHATGQAPHAGAGPATPRVIVRGPERTELPGQLSEPEEISPVPQPVKASQAGRPGGENPRLSAEQTWNQRSRKFGSVPSQEGDDAA